MAFDPWADKGQEYYNQCIATALAGLSGYPAGLLNIEEAEAELAKIKDNLVFGQPDPTIPIYEKGIVAQKANQQAAQDFLDGKTDRYTPAIGANNELELLASQSNVDLHLVPTKEELAAALVAATAPA